MSIHEFDSKYVTLRDRSYVPDSLVESMLNDFCSIRIKEQSYPFIFSALLDMCKHPDEDVKRTCIGDVRPIFRRYNFMDNEGCLYPGIKEIVINSIGYLVGYGIFIQDPRNLLENHFFHTV